MTELRSETAASSDQGRRTCGTATLEVPGASLACGPRGAERGRNRAVLFMIGAPMGASDSPRPDGGSPRPNGVAGTGRAVMYDPLGLAQRADRRGQGGHAEGARGCARRGGRLDGIACAPAVGACSSVIDVYLKEDES
jgi:hypothetical protein